MAKKKEKFKCADCGKILKTKRALVGHMWFAHNKRVGEKATMRQQIKKLEDEPRINNDVHEKIDLIVDVQKKEFQVIKSIIKLLERLTGKTKSDLDPNPEEVKPDEEEDDGLPDLFGKKKKDEKENEEDDKSCLL